MKTKLIVILFLGAVLLGTLTVGSLSSYTTVSDFSVSIYPDSSALHN